MHIQLPGKPAKSYPSSDGEKQNLANYRFISLLYCTSKLLETLIFGKLYEVIKHTIAPEQYGFRKSRSTITQMIMYMSEIFDNLIKHVLRLRKSLPQGLPWKVIGKIEKRRHQRRCTGTNRKLSKRKRAES